MLFLYFVRSFNLKFSNKRYFAAKLLGDGGKTKKYKRKQHYKQR